MTKFKARIQVDTYTYINVNSKTSKEEKERLAKTAFKNMLANNSDMCLQVTEMECLNVTPPCTLCGSDNTEHTKSQPEGVYNCRACGSLFIAEPKV